MENKIFKINILIASFDRSELLKNCLNSIDENLIELDYCIILLLKESDTKSKELLENNKYKNLKCIFTEDIPSPGKSRNLLIEQIEDEVKFVNFLDDDVKVPANYYNKCIALLTENDIDVLGGPDYYENNDNIMQQTHGVLLGNLFVTGPTYIRHSLNSMKLMKVSEINLTLCNLWIRREILDSHKFNNQLKRCEENLLLDQITSANYKLVRSSEIFVYHKRRERILDILSIQYKSGYHRGKTLFLKDAIFKPFLLIPFFAAIWLHIALLFNIYINLIVLISYVFILTSIILECLYKTRNMRSVYYSFFYTLSIHLGFSLGIFYGTIYGYFKRKELE